jgi:hypothetical protein
LEAHKEELWYSAKTVEKIVEKVVERPGSIQPDPDGQKWRDYKKLQKELQS